jgi:hypothetical protein
MPPAEAGAFSGTLSQSGKRKLGCDSYGFPHGGRHLHLVLIASEHRVITIKGWEMIILHTRIMKKEAIELYIQFGEDINAYLRDPASLPRSHQLLFQKFVAQLDRALLKSSIDTPMIFYREITGDYAEEFLEEVTKGKNELHDEGYASFSSNADIAQEYAAQC